MSQPLTKLLVKQAARTQIRRSLKATNIHPLLPIIGGAIASYFISKHWK